MRLHVLYHAGQEPVCGVDLMAELRRHGYRLTPGTLYPMLHRLERAGYLRCQNRRVGPRWRKYYGLTDQGARVLEEARLRLPELVGEVLLAEGPGGRAGATEVGGGAMRGVDAAPVPRGDASESAVPHDSGGSAADAR